jgi:7-cyano-7-deazaguanine synthase
LTIKAYDIVEPVANFEQGDIAVSKGIAIVSGGLDSVVLAHHLSRTHDLSIVSFDYGQRHKKELQFAEQAAKDLEVPWTLVDMSFMANLLHGSALTSPEVDVPEGHYADDNMRITVVPNRNSIMLNIAAGIAVAEKASFIATAVHAGDHAVYPDCRPEFIGSLTQTLRIANEGFIDPEFYINTPFIALGKEDIANEGGYLHVDFTKTWSCYKGEEVHCGKCGTCVERKEAFDLAGIHDPTEYMS